MFLCLSVLAGSWDLEAAEAIGADDPTESGAVLDLLARLVDKSMVTVESRLDGTSTRYRLLETLRQYALGRLREGGEAETVRARHARFFISLAEQAEQGLQGPNQRHWLNLLAPEEDNLREALAWAVERGEAVDGLRLGASLWRFWSMRGRLAEGRQWLEALVARSEGAAVPVALRARALSGLGHLAFAQGDLGAAAACFEESLALGRESGDLAGIAAALRNRGSIAQARGDYARATTLYEQSLALCRQLRNKSGVATCLDDLGEVARHRGEYERAAALDDEALGLQRELGDAWGMAFSLNELANVARHQGNYRRGRAFATEALVIQRELGDLRGAGYSLNNLGIMALATGDHQQAAQLSEEALILFQEAGDQRGVSVVLPGLSVIAQGHGDHEQARVLAEQALQMHRELGDHRAVAQRLDGLGRLARAAGVIHRASQLHRESLALFAQLGDQRGIAMALSGVAAVAALDGQPQRAALLFGVATTLREALHLAADFAAYVDPRTAEETMAELRSCLGEAAFAAAWEAGQTLPLERAITEAPTGTPGQPGTRSRSRPSLPSEDPLTKRERDVVRLVAQGRTNRDIGQALVISPGTARIHVEHVLAKLGVRSRAGIAAWAVDHDLT